MDKQKKRTLGLLALRGVDPPPQIFRVCRGGCTLHISSKHYMGPTPVYGARAKKPLQHADFAMKQTNIYGDIIITITLNEKWQTLNAFCMSGKTTVDRIIHRETVTSFGLSISHAQYHYHHNRQHTHRKPSQLTLSTRKHGLVHYMPQQHQHFIRTRCTQKWRKKK